MTTTASGGERRSQSCRDEDSQVCVTGPIVEEISAPAPMRERTPL